MKIGKLLDHVSVLFITFAPWYFMTVGKTWINGGESAAYKMLAAYTLYLFALYRSYQMIKKG